MTVQNVPAGTSPAVSTAAPARPAPVPAPPSWAWQRAAPFLVGAAQLITVSALTSAAGPGRAFGATQVARSVP